MQPLLGQLLQLPDLEHVLQLDLMYSLQTASSLDWTDLIHQLQLGACVHHLQLWLAVPRTEEYEDHGEAVPAIGVL